MQVRIADGEGVAESEAALRGLREAVAERAGLADERDRAERARHLRVFGNEAHPDAELVIDQPHAVGPEHRHARGPRNIGKAPLRCAFLVAAHLAVARGIHDHPAGAGLRRFPERRLDCVARHYQRHQIGLAGQRGERRIAGVPADIRVLGVDRPDRAAEMREILQRAQAERAGARRGAHDRDRARRDQPVELRTRVNRAVCCC